MLAAASGFLHFSVLGAPSLSFVSLFLPATLVAPVLSLLSLFSALGRECFLLRRAVWCQQEKTETMTGSGLREDKLGGQPREGRKER